ncbi:Cell division protein FtsK [Bacillus cereus]|nr:Cell division protein FtsK [Bacillus cereus]
MAKQKQRGTKAKARRTIKPTLYYEIVGLTLFALSIITILQLGVVGKSFVLFFRFFFGEWYIIGVLGVIALSVSFVIKRGWPNLLNKRLIGFYLIVLAILMFSHITLFNLLTKDGAVQNTSVIVSTKDNFFLEMKKGPDSVHLGGGMFGALMFATCYFLFDEVGAYIIGIILVILGILCITNKHIGEVLAPVGRVLRSQFQVMQGDYKDWRAKRTAEQTEKKKQQEAQGANVLQNKKKLLSRWKKSQLILRLFRISLRIIL